MLREKLKTEQMVIEGRTYTVNYFQLTTPRGHRRYSSEVQLSLDDFIILDDDTMVGLEAKVGNLVPSIVYCRLLVHQASAA